MNKRTQKKRAKAARAFEQRLVESVQQAVAIKRGELTPARQYTLPRIPPEVEHVSH